MLVSDLGLPDGTGDDLLRELRETTPTLPAIAFSGYGATADVESTTAAGFAAHLVKPVDLDDLVATIRRVVDQSTS